MVSPAVHYRFAARRLLTSATEDACMADQPWPGSNPPCRPKH